MANIWFVGGDIIPDYVIVDHHNECIGTNIYTSSSHMDYDVFKQHSYDVMTGGGKSNIPDKVVIYLNNNINHMYQAIDAMRTLMSGNEVSPTFVFYGVNDTLIKAYHKLSEPT